VVLVALQDQLLDATHEELSTLHPNVSFRKACVSWAVGPASTDCYWHSDGGAARHDSQHAAAYSSVLITRSSIDAP